MNLNIRNLIVASILVFGVNACQDECYYYEDQITYEEVLQPLSEIKASFEIKEDFEISSPGNIYTYDKYLLVGEKFKGIHILDNSNPSNPVKIKFIELHGNENFAVIDNILVADNGPDVLSIDISDMNSIELKNRAESINMHNVRGDKYVVGYNAITSRVRVNCTDNQRGNSNTLSDGTAAFSPIASALSSSTHSTVGKGGSMSKFAIIDRYLYIINSSELIPIDVNNPIAPVRKNTIGLVQGNVETVFPYKSYLYMGTSNGVLVYNTASSKEAPAYVANIRHVIGCDPVIVFDDIAFSTIRGGSTCRNNDLNLLNSYDVSNPSNARQLSSTAMLSPYGLGANATQLFVCQGQKGLFVYDWTKTTSPIFRHSYPDIHAYDVIVNGNVLIVTADNGLFQFDISNPDNIRYLSKLVEF
jgi:hypothetical protein